MSHQAQILIEDDNTNVSKLDLLSTDSQKMVSLEYNNPIEVFGFWLFHKDAPETAQVHFHHTDNGGTDIYKFCHYILIEGTCLDGRFYEFDHGIFIEPGEKIKFMVKNAATGVAFSAWATVKISRDHID